MNNNDPIESVLRTIRAGEKPTREEMRQAILSPGFSSCKELRNYLANMLEEKRKNK